MSETNNGYVKMAINKIYLALCGCIQKHMRAQKYVMTLHARRWLISLSEYSVKVGGLSTYVCVIIAYE